jgi:hypothetical protein
MYRAKHLFCESPDKDEDTTADGSAKEPIVAVYPSIRDDKLNLNSVFFESEKDREVISISCFSRPTTQGSQSGK